MRRYFGTDGIRRIANTELSPELVYKVAKAGAYVLSKHTDKTPTILIGRDTRLSGTLIESAMVAGFLSYGANVKLLGVIPTPGVAYLTRKFQADASVVISASHNTFEFNGIKYFSNKGMKIPDNLEEEIEEVMESGKLNELTAVSEKIGVSEVRTEYVYFFRKNLDDNIEKFNNPDFKVVIDTANGATYQVADKVFSTLGINHVIINNEPNGVNINAGCGSTHLEMLKEYVIKNKMSLGIAYDGDGDRCLAVDENGEDIDGDKLIAIISKYLKQKGKLKKDTIVATVMSNLGLNKYAENHERQSTMDFHHQLKAAILDAVDEGMISRDPTRKAIIKGKTPREKKDKYLNQFELQKLIADLDLKGKINTDWLIYLIAKTGIRFSEALAITPKDFDFPHQTLNIEKTWNYKENGGFEPTKNKSSERKVQLDWQTVIQFSEIIKGLEEEKPIFINKKIYNSTINDTLKRHCINAEIPVITIHGLRHTHASILLYAGVSIASVAHRLGHASMSTTQKTYLHIIQELENTDIDKIMRALTTLNN